MRPHVQPPGQIHVGDAHLIEAAGHLCAGVGMQHVEPAVSRGRREDGRLESGIVADIQPETFRPATGRGDLGSDRLRPRSVEICDDHGRARAGHGERAGPADPRAPAVTKAVRSLRSMKFTPVGVSARGGAGSPGR